MRQRRSILPLEDPGARKWRSRFTAHPDGVGCQSGPFQTDDYYCTKHKHVDIRTSQLQEIGTRLLRWGGQGLLEVGHDASDGAHAWS